MPSAPKKPNSIPPLWKDVVIALSQDEIYYISYEDLEKFKVPESTILSNDYEVIRFLLQEGTVAASVPPSTPSGGRRYLLNMAAMKQAQYVEMYQKDMDTNPVKTYWEYRKHTNGPKSGGNP